MTPYYFGDSRSPLFGCYAEPSVESRRAHGVVLCAPTGHEYLRSHWAMRQLGSALGRAGYHVFRFDYGSTGDSAGESSAGDVGRWTSDIQSAAQELRDASGVRKVSLVGLRLGATLAVAASAAKPVESLVLWDPVVSGRAYLSDLEALHHAMLVDDDRFAPSPARALKRRFARLFPSLAAPTATRDELIGFPLPPAMRAGIEALDLTRVRFEAGTDGRALVKRVVLVKSEAKPQYAELEALIRAASVPLQVHQVGAPARWDDVAEIENALLPGETPRTIAAALTHDGR